MRAARFVLRIEDTDASRNRPEWTDGILSAMAWLGIGPDQYEGPYFQSANLAQHQAAAQRLRDQGQAYYCDCTREVIVERTGDSHRGYDGFCRDRGLEPGEGRALRFRTPDEGATVVDDQIRGKTVFENATLEDFVIARADGSVLFLLANVVDDMIQGITLVSRAEEHLSNTPKQVLLWAALGQEPPAWAHQPLIVNEKRQKLSKRRDRVSLESFRDEGYLAEAMRNYLMLLGWSPRGDREIVPWATIEAEFRLDEVEPVPGILRRQEAAGVQRRVHQGDAASRTSSPPASRGWSRRPRRGPRTASILRSSPRWRRWRRPGSRCWPRSPPWSISRSSTSRRSTRRRGTRP